MWTKRAIAILGRMDTSIAIPRSTPAAAPRHRGDLRLPLALLALVAIPVLAGAVRLAALATGSTAVPDHARFAADPWPVVAHIVSATIFTCLGAFQFVPRLRARPRSWHRRAGWLVMPPGFVASLSGLHMALVYPPAEHDGPLLRGLRVVVGAATIGCLVAGIATAVRRDFAAHARWSTRAYALFVGAGTQALILVPQVLLGVRESETSYAISMGAGWLLNAVVAEWALRQRATADATGTRVSRRGASLHS